MGILGDLLGFGRTQPSKPERLVVLEGRGKATYDIEDECDFQYNLKEVLDRQQKLGNPPMFAKLRFLNYPTSNLVAVSLGDRPVGYLSPDRASRYGIGLAKLGLEGQAAMCGAGLHTRVDAAGRKTIEVKLDLMIPPRLAKDEAGQLKRAAYPPKIGITLAVLRSLFTADNFENVLLYAILAISFFACYVVSFGIGFIIIAVGVSIMFPQSTTTLTEILIMGAASVLATVSTTVSVKSWGGGDFNPRVMFGSFVVLVSLFGLTLFGLNFGAVQASISAALAIPTAAYCLLVRRK